MGVVLNLEIGLFSKRPGLFSKRPKGLKAKGTTTPWASQRGQLSMATA
ncbi:MAG: hypothetical protein WBM00_06770 [Solirubrobacterales bacterium]